MTESLVVLLVGLVAGVAGGVGGALAASVILRGEDQRWETRVADVRSQMEDMEGRWLSWQRRVNKRNRDASGRSESDDLPLGRGTGQSQIDQGHELLRRARARGIVR